MTQKPETWNLPFTAKVGTQNRLAIDPDIVKLAKIEEGDTVTLVLTQIYRKEK